MQNNTPTVSVVMSCYNRKDYIAESIESILNQTYSDFEFIILDNASTDGTSDIIKDFASKDKRIIYIRNNEDKGLITNLNTGLSLARGKYIARMDDDDISYITRFQKQVEFMDSHPDVAVCGTYIETFGEENIDPWVKDSDSDILAILMNFFNPMCHPTVMIRKDYLTEHNLSYSLEDLYAEEYGLWKEIILRKGKLTNIPEVLLKYRTHKKRMSSENSTANIQIKNALKIKKELLSRFFNKKEIKQIIKTIQLYPFTANNIKELYSLFKKMEKKDKHNVLNNGAIDKIINKYCGKQSEIDIIAASSDVYSQHLSTAIASILKNSLPFDSFNFTILDGGISEKNKKRLLALKKIKNFNIEFLKIDNRLFEKINMPPECGHIDKQTYYRYLIPTLKPDLDKCIYIDCDVIVVDSLNKLWHTDLGNNYVGAVEELYKGIDFDCKNLGVNSYFNAGILLINNKLWRDENISEKLFENTFRLQDKIRWADQDILNYTFKDRVIFISPRYNLQQNAYFDTGSKMYTEDQINIAKDKPIIIHYNGCTKPWSETCQHKLWRLYYDYLKLTQFKTPYNKFIRRQRLEKNKKVIENIFSIKNQERHKVLTCLGLKIKFKRKLNIRDLHSELEVLKTQQNQNFSQLNEQIKTQHQQVTEQLSELQQVTEQLSELQQFAEFDDKFKYVIKNYYGNNYLLYLNEQIQKANSVLNLHGKVFTKYKNTNKGKTVVLVATGPTLKYYTPVENAVHVGVNNAYKNEKLNLEYMFYQDIFSKTKQDIENFISYQENKTIKFLGILNDKICPNSVIPESYITERSDVCRYYVEDPVLYKNFTYDICSSILGDSYSIVFPAMQFILYTQPSKIYIVGCDCSDAGYFDGSAQLHTYTPQVIEGWYKLKNFVSIHYPETEIISVNPVGLKGLFKDVYTESYLLEHPEIKEDLE